MEMFAVLLFMFFILFAMGVVFALHAYPLAWIKKHYYRTFTGLILTALYLPTMVCLDLAILFSILPTKH